MLARASSAAGIYVMEADIPVKSSLLSSNQNGDPLITWAQRYGRSQGCLTFFLITSDIAEAGDTPTTDKYDDSEAQAVLDRILAAKAAERQAKADEQQGH
jgi:hypothetical protein